MTIRLVDEIGSVLVGRQVAERLRGRVEEAARHGAVVLDFDGVLAVSPSFADELFAKLAVDVRDSGHLSIEGMDAGLESIKRFVVAGRD
jgi:STAS-like domain of unknown function (DUF4325)